ncbi:MAG TPA: hypothetical protein PKW33_12870 [Anaerolineaceae bacterium]|nr:hypothetical protein [Anaerolineaceae bacterium]HPN52475.1 hypothetical protein [Anaerolineaceae bacterium]
MFKPKILLVVVLAFALLLTAAASARATGAAQPARIDLPGETRAYAGRLTTASGAAAADGAYDFNFALYDAPEGGRLLWSEAQAGVALKDGAFTVQLGQVNPLPPGAAGWLAVEVRGPGEAAFTLLSPRQALEAAASRVPADISAPAAETCAHDHFGETWTGSDGSWGLSIVNPFDVAIYAESTSGVGLRANTTSGAAAVYANNEGSGTGIVAYSKHGKAISAAGPIYSTMYSIFYLSPFGMVVRGSTGLTLTPMDDGSMRIRNDSGVGMDKYVAIPVSTFGNLLGSNIQVDSLEVCYKVSNASDKIVATAMVKNNGDGLAAFLFNNIADRTSTTLQCYTIDSGFTQVLINNTTWVQLNLNFASTGASSDIRIYSLKLILSEQN